MRADDPAHQQHLPVRHLLQGAKEKVPLGNPQTLLKGHGREEPSLVGDLLFLVLPLHREENPLREFIFRCTGFPVWYP
jgi:hypothetical protein